ncbi:cytochrome C oxidase subunit IV family protein [Rhizobium alvei]|uniref:Cytochrome C oxidase subunit IV family protein n=1 Tax=Rhizobium alvei TaxID=1132659 RepID=A0ABT8YUB6_9HYPH|nr:cytochrome C oxidase subunit IV family protein [Rhizobium alvei]MDO6966879.1 cytochrome C oxidase subunit IV family protein [Rhizobium alvei]
MQKQKQVWLMGAASLTMLAAVSAGLIAAQWKHEAIPFAAFGVVLLLTLVKSRWVVMDFMGLRGKRPGLASALVAWVGFFALAASAKSALALLVG